MKVINILQETAEILNLEQVKEVFKSEGLENEEVLLENSEILSLFNLLKLSIRELCTNYAPAVKTEIINVENNEFKLTDLVNYIRLRTVKKDSEVVPYKIVNRAIQFSENGKYEISYYTYPEINSLNEKVDFLQNLNSDVIVFGLSAYYCLSKGMFEDFHKLHEMYIERAECLKDMKVFTMPQRSWE